MPTDKNIKKVLVIGSGPIVIGQAAEFDYAGAQACRVLKQAGLEVVLVNSNPATIMTDTMLADEIYLEPLTKETVKRIILKEKPDSMLATLGGQTGLTLAMQLSQEGFLQANGVRLLGTNEKAISLAEDRELFKEKMLEIGQPCIPSGIATTLEAAVECADRIGYPVIIRPAFTLGGSGGGVAYNKDEFMTIAANGLLLSPISQILVEKYIYGWKEIEFETMRDTAGNSIIVCSMENIDPVGVHTGDSIVAAPALTLSDGELEMLRNASLDIVRALDIEGACNVQFAFDPVTSKYAVIEVNPRVSRSSALASKATGYPIAKVATKVALGFLLGEIVSPDDGGPSALSEPVVDYVVVKFPKWPFDKFHGAPRTLGTQMKATGEVMSIADTFEAALMKAVRGAELSLDTLRAYTGEGDITERLAVCDDLRIFRIFEALDSGVSVEKISEITKIDTYFIERIGRLADYERSLRSGLDREKYELGKKLGYTDAAIERISGCRIPEKKLPVYRRVEVCSAGTAGAAPYYYAVSDGECQSRPIARGAKKRIIVLGSGPIRIGQGIEFDYSCVHCVGTLRRLGYEVIIINNNPETVSTDFDTADRLYFEPLTLEDVLGVCEVEKPEGVVVAFGGQTAIKLAKALDSLGIKIFGTSASGIDTAEDREKFDALLEARGIRRPKGRAVLTAEKAIEAAHELGYPVLLRPSYVIGGQNMVVSHDDECTLEYMRLILEAGEGNTVLVDKYLGGSELEVDVISDGTDVLIPGIMQHIERAGVHSGDSIAVYPPYSINDRMLEKIVEVSEYLALSLETRGLVNIQYLIYNGELFVIEVNPRASRTIPYISKVTGVPMVDLAARVMVGESLSSMGYGTGLYHTPPYFAVKVPVFSFEKLLDVDSSLGPEMKSTGEVLGVGSTLTEALFKGLLASGCNLSRRRSVFFSVADPDKFEVISVAKKFSDLGMRLYATEGTAREIATLGCDVGVCGTGDDRTAEVIDAVERGDIDVIVYTGDGSARVSEDYVRIHRAALRHGVVCLTSLDTAGTLADIFASRYNEHNTELVDIAHLRHERRTIAFAKMEAAGNDYIYIEDPDFTLSCPESLAISLCDRHRGIGGDGLVLIGRSKCADAAMRIYNRDGSEGKMAGNSIRCVAKYLYDRGIVRKDIMTVETASGVRTLKLYTMNGLVSSVSVDMGRPSLVPAEIPVKLEGESAVDRDVTIGGKAYRVTCVNVGNPHCVVFCPRVDDVDTETVGPMFENDPIFPERVNTEFVRVVNRRTLKMRVWERGNGETFACGTGACAAAVAAVENGLCDRNADITVKLRGGDLVVFVGDDGITLTGGAALVCSGSVVC